MERTIGNLEQEIRQPSNPFANLAQQGIRRCQMNALKAMLPELDPQSSSIPRGATNLRNGYVLLPKRDRYPTDITTDEKRVITAYLGHPTAPKLRRWARLRLPNGQVARSQFTELVKAPENVRMARNIKVFVFYCSNTFVLTLLVEIVHEGIQRIAEVRYFTRLLNRDADNVGDDSDTIDNPDRTLFTNVALVTLYSDPDPLLLHESFGVVVLCTKLGEESLTVIKISAIQAVVAMIPHKPSVDEENRYFLVEKSGMELARFGDEDDEDDNTEQ
ncbi:hypothetical protein EV363DRAFT_1151144 [Boletus edulis]|nr:hypothetical protein EV363DRAFT_1151144 [Boletus edulis]